MPVLHLKTTERRVGVVGIYASGKTVLMTSLVNHLQEHDPERFQLDGGSGPVALRKFRPLPPDEGWEAFNAAGHRDALVHRQRWPEKTRDRSQYVCSFERSDWRFSDVKLKLYDLPGERMADVWMYGQPYADWSDHRLALMTNDTAYRKCSVEFLSTLDDPAADERRLIDAYKLSLARLILSCKPYITPSTFLLDVKGQLGKPTTAEGLAAGRLSGLDALSEFVPLSVHARGRWPERAAEYARHYEAYQQLVVNPFVAALQGCDALIVLVDVTMLLAGGVGMYDDNRQILRDLLDTVKPGESPLGTLVRNVSHFLLPHSVRPGWVHRIAFVVPKIDRVHPSDRDRAEALLRRMIGKYAEDFDGLQMRFFNCAAVASTQTFPGEGRFLLGQPRYDAAGKVVPPGGEPQKLEVSELPEDWPDDWPGGRYHFPEVWPRVPVRRDRPPEQIGLDRVVSFILG